MKKEPRFHTNTLYENLNVFNIKKLYLKSTVIFLNSIIMQRTSFWCFSFKKTGKQN